MAPKKRKLSSSTTVGGFGVGFMSFRDVFRALPGDMVLRLIGQIPLRGGGIRYMHQALSLYRSFLHENGVWSGQLHRNVNRRMQFVEALARSRGIELFPEYWMYPLDKKFHYFYNKKK